MSCTSYSELNGTANFGDRKVLSHFIYRREKDQFISLYRIKVKDQLVIYKMKLNSPIS